MVRGFPRFAIRNVKHGRVTIAGRVFAPNVPCDLTGRWAFGLYYTGDTMQPYVSLWGTERMYRANDTDGEFETAYAEMCRLTGERVEGFPEIPSGAYNMNREGDTFVAYRSKGYDWWNQVAA